MCLGGSPGFNPDPPKITPAPSKREKTAEELRRPKGQQARQELGARLGVQLLRAPLLNAPK